MKQVTDGEATRADYKVSVIAVPKPFHGHIGIIQDNAISSWTHLPMAREIILIGEEEGVAEAAAKAGASHCRMLRRDSLGTPLLDDIFRVAEEQAQADWLCYVNADIILMPEFGDAVCRAVSALGKCLIISRRWNLDIPNRLSFNNGWAERLRTHAAESAELFSVYGIDVFVFPKGFFPAIPPFSLGRSCWDNWIIAEARREGWPVVDVTAQFTVIHQNHSYSGFASMDDIRSSQQGLRNFWLAGDTHFLFGRVDDATHELRNGHIVSSGRKSVSVIVPHTGSPGQLRHCLRALSHQSYPRTFIEIIVVDNSDENSGAAVALEFPYVRMTHESRPGLAAARNKGAAIANGEILAFLDPDCRPARDWLEEAVAAAERHKYGSIIACNIKLKRSVSGSAGVQWYQAIKFEEQRTNAEAGKAWTTSALIVPLSIWRETGPFDIDFSEAACENWQWSTRATSIGIPFAYAVDAVVTRAVQRTWRELRKQSQRLVWGAPFLAENYSNRKQIEFSLLRAAYTKRLRRELSLAFHNNRVSVGVRLSSALAAICVWLWTLKEMRKQLKATEVRRRRLRKISARREVLRTSAWLPRLKRKVARARR